MTDTAKTLFRQGTLVPKTVVDVIDSFCPEDREILLHGEMTDQKEDALIEDLNDCGWHHLERMGTEEFCKLCIKHKTPFIPSWRTLREMLN